MQQCTEGWHRTDEPEHHAVQQVGEDQADGEQQDPEDADRRVRSTRRRQDAPDLPRVPQEDRTVGRVFATPDGRVVNVEGSATDAELEGVGKDGTFAHTNHYA